MYQITELDARILDILQRDASKSVAEVAREANTSSATCWRRIRALEEAGVLGQRVWLIDPARVGRQMDAFCQVRMKSQDAKSRGDFERAMELEPTIVEVYSVSGEWDYMLHLLVRDVADLESILMRRVLEHDCVAGTSTIFALRRVKHVTQVPV
jgi:DNA-binding Lrp family transcriptional regulator